MWKRFLSFCTRGVGCFYAYRLQRSGTDPGTGSIPRARQGGARALPLAGQWTAGPLGSFLAAIESKMVKYSFFFSHSHRHLTAEIAACPFLGVRASERARHTSSMDCSSAPIVMEIALETVAPAYIFRSVSEPRSRKTAARGGKPPAGLPAMPLPPAAWWGLAGSLGGDGI